MYNAKLIRSDLNGMTGAHLNISPLLQYVDIQLVGTVVVERSSQSSTQTQSRNNYIDDCKLLIRAEKGKAKTGIGWR